MREKRKDPRLEYGFLLDRDVSKAVGFFPEKRRCTLAKAGLREDASDREIVEKAWKLNLTIVTSNGDHFVREVMKFLKQTKRKDYHELCGLVVLPNGYEYQKRLLQGVEKKLRLGSEKLTWADVASKDCFVRVKKNGNLEVKRFPRCFYCLKQELKQ